MSQKQQEYLRKRKRQKIQVNIWRVLLLSLFIFLWEF